MCVRLQAACLQKSNVADLEGFFLILDLLFHVLDRVAWLHVKGDGLAVKVFTKICMISKYVVFCVASFVRLAAGGGRAAHSHAPSAQSAFFFHSY